MVPVLKEPSVVNLLQSALFQEPLDVVAVLSLDGRSFRCNLLLYFHLLHNDGVSDLRNFLQILSLPLGKGHTQIVHLEVLHEFLANPGDFPLLSHVAITVEDVQEALHVHRLFEHVLDTEHKSLLLPNSMPPAAEDEALA